MADIKALIGQVATGAALSRERRRSTRSKA